MINDKSTYHISLNFAKFVCSLNKPTLYVAINLESPPPPGIVNYVAVTQDKRSCLCSERHDEYLFGRAKTGGLGQVTTKKKKQEKRQGHLPRRCSLCPWGPKYITAT